MFLLVKRWRSGRALGLAVGLVAGTSGSFMAAQASGPAGLLSPILGPVAGSPAVSTGVSPFAVPAGGYAAFATGTVLHAGLAAGLAGVDLVSSTAATTSSATATPLASELGRTALPVLADRGSFGQGAGAGLGVGLLPGLSAGLLGTAEAKAPPSTAPVESEALPVSLAPLVSANPVHSRAQARSAPAGACVLGSELAYGRSDAADLSLSGLTSLTNSAKVALTGTGSGDPVSQSVSRTMVVPGAAGRLGLLSETSQRLGPVALLAGSPKEHTLLVKGQWSLRASADGQAGSVALTPEGMSGSEPVVEVHNQAGQVVAQATAADFVSSGQRVAGSAGVKLKVEGVGEIVVGEQPRIRGGDGAPTVTGTRVEAAVDLVRVKLLGQDIRLGHMETGVVVPAEGLTCPGPEVTATPQQATVEPGGEVGFTVKVRNPNDGELSALFVDIRFSGPAGVVYEVVPGPGGNRTADGVRYALSPIRSGQTVELISRLKAAPTSGPGTIRVAGKADGRYGDGGLAVPLATVFEAAGPAVAGVAAAEVVERPAEPAPVAKVPPAPVVKAAPRVAAVQPVEPEPVTTTTTAPPPPVEVPQIELVTPSTATTIPKANVERSASERLKGDDDDRGWWPLIAVAILALAATAVVRRMRANAAGR